MYIVADMSTGMTRGLQRVHNQFPNLGGKREQGEQGEGGGTKGGRRKWWKKKQSLADDIFLTLPPHANPTVLR